MQKEKIVIENLNLSFADKNIISNLNLTLLPAEIHTVVGLSGVGKSQLLRTIINLNAPRVKSNINKKMRIVFQENNLIPWLSLKRNVEVANNTKNLKKIDDLFEQVELSQFKDYKPHQVSGGMQQRVSLIRAMSDDCELLLLDEPFSKLDPINKQINYEVLLRLWKKTQPAILMVTHDLDEAIFFSQKISFFSKAEKKISHTETVNFSYPRSSVGIRKNDEYHRLYTQFTQLLQEDFRRVAME